MRKALLAATTLVCVSLCGTHQAGAAPPAPVGPTDIAVPTAPPDPDPCDNRPVRCDLTTAPTFTIPTELTEPTNPTSPTSPAGASEPSAAPVTTTTPQRPVERPQAAPKAVPTPHHGDDGAGPVNPIGTVNWWLIAAVVLALLALAATGAVRCVQRSERRPS